MEKDDMTVVVGLLVMVILLGFGMWCLDQRLNCCWKMLSLQNDRIDTLRLTLNLPKWESDEEVEAGKRKDRVPTDESEIEWNPDDEPTGDLDGDSWKKRGE